MILYMKRDRSIILANKDEYLDDDIHDYCIDVKYQKLRDLVNERRYDVSETDITYRMIGNWDQNGLLPPGVRQGLGWRKFTFIEMVWLRIIRHLRDFGLSLEKIELTRECILQLNEENNTYDSFEYYIVNTWKNSLDPYVIVVADGHADIATLPEIKSLGGLIGHRDMLLISLASVIEEMNEEVEEKSGIFTLTKKYKELLLEINSKDNTEVSVKIRNGEMFEINSTSTILDPKHARDMQRKIKQAGLYASVTEQIEKGQQKSIKITKHKRL